MKTDRNDQAGTDDRDGVVLLDVAPGLVADFDASFLERTGHPVVVCHGPDEGTCPLVAGERCEKFSAAHGVVFQLDLDRPDHREILARYRALAAAEVPIRAVVRADQRDRYADALAGIELWSEEPSVADLDGFAARVEAADRSRRA